MQRTLRILTTTLGVGLAAATATPAATLTWDDGGASPTNPADGSTSLWDTSTAVWSNSSTDAIWVNANNDTAVFGNSNGTAGTVNLGSAITAGGITFNAATSGNYTIAGGTGPYTLTLAGTTPTITTNVDATISANLAGSNGFVKTGDGKLTLSGTNNVTLTGGMRLTAGTVAFAANTNVAAGTITMDGGTLQFIGTGGYNAVNRAITLTTAGGTLDDSAATTNDYIRYSGAISYSGSGPRTLTFTGTGTKGSSIDGVLSDGTGGATSVVKNGTGNWSLSGANSSYTGSTTINTGVLRTLATNAISPTSTVYIAKVGTLSLNADQTIANLQDGAGGGGTLTRLYDGTSVLTVQSGLFSGVIKDANVSRLIALTKSTGGTLTLSGLNTYTGATTVTGGTLAISAGNINGTSGITINGGELKYNSATALTKAITFTSGKISGTGAINTAVTVGTGATLAPGNSPGSQTYSSLAWTTGGAYQWETNSKTGTAGTDWDLLNVTGALDISGLDGSNKFTIDITGLAGVGDAPAASTTWTILDYDSLTGTFSAEMFTLAPTGFNGTWNSANWSIGNNTSNGSLELTYVPEPAGLALLLVGAVGLLRRRRA